MAAWSSEARLGAEGGNRVSSVFVLDFTRYFRCKVNVLFCNQTVPPPDEFQVWSAGFEAEIRELGSETRSHSVPL